MLGYHEDEPREQFDQIRLSGEKKEERKFQQIVNVKNKLGELLYPVEVMNSVYDKDIAKQTICAVL